MERPLADKRPIGPFAQMESTSATAIIQFNKRLPKEHRDEIKSDIMFHMEAQGVDVEGVEFSSEIRMNSAFVHISQDSVVLDEIQSGVSASTSEIEDTLGESFRVEDVKMVFN